jgi:hypothetical protein
MGLDGELLLVLAPLGAGGFPLDFIDKVGHGRSNALHGSFDQAQMRNRLRLYIRVINIESMTYMYPNLNII